MKASELKNLDLSELMDELNSLDFENVGGWPTPIKIGAAVLVLVAVVTLGYFLSISDANQALDQQRIGVGVVGGRDKSSLQHEITLRHARNRYATTLERLMHS